MSLINKIQNKTFQLHVEATERNVTPEQNHIHSYHFVQISPSVFIYNNIIGRISPIRRYSAENEHLIDLFGDEPFLNIIPRQRIIGRDRIILRTTNLKILGAQPPLNSLVISNSRKMEVFPFQAIGLVVKYVNTETSLIKFEHKELAISNRLLEVYNTFSLLETKTNPTEVDTSFPSELIDLNEDLGPISTRNTSRSSRENIRRQNSLRTLSETYRAHLELMNNDTTSNSNPIPTVRSRPTPITNTIEGATRRRPTSFRNDSERTSQDGGQSQIYPEWTNFNLPS